MSTNRATKSGYALEASQKMQSKYDNGRAKIALEWVFSQVSQPLPAGYDGNATTTQELLKSGVVLAKLTNIIEPGSVKPALLAKEPTMAFKQMELINLFTDTMLKKEYTKKSESFQTVDLFEGQNMSAVIICIEAVGRTLVTNNRGGFGKAESQGDKRDFTEEQLREGQSIISLQMGTNKGASQAGLNMGKQRSILD